MEDGLVSLVTGFRTERIRLDGAGRAVLVSEDGRGLAPADAVVVLTGFRPDLCSCRSCGWTWIRCSRHRAGSRLRLTRTSIPAAPPPRRSRADLAHPEPSLYLVGMKSYGRAPTFLAMTGYEQVRSVAAELAGDHEAAARTELMLPDTGVCGGAGPVRRPGRRQRRRVLRARPAAAGDRLSPRTLLK